MVEKKLASNVEHCLKQSCVSSVMFYSETVCSFTFEKGKKKTSNLSLLCCYCHVVLSAKKGFEILCRNFQLRPRKSVCFKEVSAKNCPLHRGFLIRILYETYPFLKKVSAGRRCPL